MFNTAVANRFEKRRMWYAAFFPCLLLVILWTLRLLSEWGFNTDLHRLGVYPRTLSGLLGVLTEPLVHANGKHLLSNSISLFVLGWCLFYFYKDLGYVVFPIIWVSQGFITWCIGRASWHVGASGLIYGLSFFLFFSGIFRRYAPLMAISFLVVFLYGSIIWNMLPVWELIEENISWEGHLSGALSGFLCACLFRNAGPQKPVEPFDEEDDDDESRLAECDNEESLENREVNKEII
jgi:membrane associated rhomboid family serine protease